MIKTILEINEYENKLNNNLTRSKSEKQNKKWEVV